MAPAPQKAAAKAAPAPAQVNDTGAQTYEEAEDILGDFNAGGSLNGQDLPYPEAGKYRLKPTLCKAIRRWDGVKMYVVEFEVITSVLTETGKTPHPPGAKFGWIQRLDHQPAVKNLSMFAATSLGVPPKDVTVKNLIEFCDQQGGQLPGGVLNALGVEVDALFFSGVSRKGNPITKVNFTSVAGKTLVDLSA